MISIILYGRNDSYGYNLHKRAAISLNCMTEVLTDPQDEIIFVDYNTPDDFPTFPEAIQDTLTQKAKSLLRILRVRPKQHERFRKQTHLECLEPIARNVGIRRSNPSNRWILSTNTDMVFVPRQTSSLSEIAAELSDAYYHLPRFEVPETLWESADRMDARGTIEAFARWGRDLHLNEIVYTSHADVRYDGPGDFQLILRSDLVRMNGFHEGMLLGWHVDSNIARRLSLLPRSLGDIVDQLYGYHCDHTRQVTAAHRPHSAQNDQKIFFEKVTRAAVPGQATSWGLAGETVEELSVNATSKSYTAALHDAITQALEQPTTTGYSPTSFNHLDYPTDHVLPFLADSLASYPRTTKLGWIGSKRSLLARFARIWHQMGFSEPIIVFAQAQCLGPDLPDHCVWAAWEDVCSRASAFVFDWGKPDNGGSLSGWSFERDPIIQEVTRGFRRAVRYERHRLETGDAQPRRFIGINAICNAVEGVFNNNVGAALTPLSTHLRQGFVAPGPAQGLLSALYVGEAGQRLPAGITTLPGVAGYVFYGPYLDLDSGYYRVTFEFEKIHFRERNPPSLHLEVVSGALLIAFRDVAVSDLNEGVVSLEFSIPRDVDAASTWPRVEFRLKTPGTIDLTVRSASFEELGEEPPNVMTVRDFDCMPLLSVGLAGRLGRSLLPGGRRAIRARRGVSDLVAYGPHVWLEGGRYEATFQFDVAQPNRGGAISVYAATHQGRRILGTAQIEPRQAGLTECSLEFELENDVPPPELGLLEFLVWSDGQVQFSLLSVRVRFLSPPQTMQSQRHEPTANELLHLLQVGSAARGEPGAIVSLPGKSGTIFQGPCVKVGPGFYRLELQLKAIGARTMGNETGFDIAAVCEARLLAHREIARSEIEDGRLCFDFEVLGGAAQRELEFVLRTAGHAEVVISSVTLRETLQPNFADAVANEEILRLLAIRPPARWKGAPDSSHRLMIHSALGQGGIAAYGPYIALSPGEYRVTFAFLIGRGLPNASIKVDVACNLGKKIVAERLLTPKRGLFARNLRSAWIAEQTSLRFSVSSDRSGDVSDFYEFRVWSSRKLDFYVSSVRLERLSVTDRAVSETLVAPSS